MAQGDITRILGKIHEGQPQASDELFSRVYKDLRRLAATCMRSERPGHTLQPTALVNEVYLRLKDGIGANLDDHAHFFAAALNLMRQILIDHARARVAKKRGRDVVKINFDDVQITSGKTSAEELLAANEALQRLATVSARQATIFELRVFGGYSIEETAKIVNIGPRMVDRDWRAARVWLRRELTRDM